MSIIKSDIPDKNGNKWYFRITYKDLLGKKRDHKSEKFKKKSEAEEAEVRFRASIGEIPNSSNLTIRELFEELYNEKSYEIKPQTLKKFDDRFKQIKPLENYTIKDLNVNIINKWKKGLKDKKFKISHSNKIIELLKQIIRYSAETYNTSDATIKFLKSFKEIDYQKKKIDFFTYEEYKKFDSVIKDHDWHTFFETLYFMGLRQGECQALTWEDIDLNKKTLSVDKTLTTKIKGEKWTISSPKTRSSVRILPIPKRLLNDLKIMKKEAKSYKNYNNTWFVFGNTEPFRESTIAKYKNKYCKEAGVKQIRIHDFRHSCASLLINHGANITLVSKYLGHSDIKMTLNTYSHMYKSELNKLTDELDNL